MQRWLVGDSGLPSSVWTSMSCTQAQTLVLEVAWGLAIFPRAWPDGSRSVDREEARRYFK